MTKPDFIQLFNLLSVAFRTGDNKDKAMATADLYWTKFNEVTTDVFQAAVHRHIDQGTYFPTVKELKLLTDRIIVQQEEERRPDPMHPYNGMEGDYAARRRREIAAFHAEREQELQLIKAGKPMPGIGIVPLKEDGRIDFVAAWAIMQATMDARMMERAKALKGAES